MLEVDTELVKQAVSLYCRLRFAKKLDPETEQDRARRHPSWLSKPIADERCPISYIIVIKYINWFLQPSSGYHSSNPLPNFNI